MYIFRDAEFSSLQSLSMLLNGTPFAFVIDLAALASRREYLKLDKWLTDKIREHGVSWRIFFKLVVFLVQLVSFEHIMLTVYFEIICWC